MIIFIYRTLNITETSILAAVNVIVSVSLLVSYSSLSFVGIPFQDLYSSFPNTNITFFPKLKGEQLKFCIGMKIVPPGTYFTCQPTIL